MKKLIFILLLFLSVNSFAHRYYVSSSDGDDSDTGLTSDLAWATISKVNGFSFAAGDTISFKDGDTWRETLTVPRSGTSGAYMVFNNYGFGAKPKILGSAEVTVWDDMGGKIWRSDNTVLSPEAGTYPGRIFFNESGTITWGLDQKADSASLTAEYHWVWVANYIYVYSATDPGVAYTSVEVAQRQNAVELNSKEYLKFDSLDIRYSCLAGIKEKYPQTNLSGLTIQNCNICYIGDKGGGAAYGIAYSGYSVVSIYKNTIYEVGRRAISQNPSATGIVLNNIIIDGNTCYNSYHSGIDLILPANTTCTNYVVRNNFLYQTADQDMVNPESWDMAGIFMAVQGTLNGTITSPLVYNNILKGLSDKGIDFERVVTPFAYNNTIYGNNPAQTEAGAHIYITGATTNATIKNNILYNNNVFATNPSYQCLFKSTAATILDMDYNLYYCTDPLTAIIQWGTGGTNYHMNDWATFKTARTQELNSPTPADPSFTDDPTDLTLALGSPAIGAGIGVGVNTDYNGAYHNDPPDLGAIAYSAAPVVPPEIPTVTTGSITYTAVTANVSYEITSDGGGTLTNRGVCYSTSANPTITDRKTVYTASVSSFTDVLRGLKGGVTYHARAYATNESGTSYGADVEFTTLAHSTVLNGGVILLNNGNPIIVK